MSVGKFLTIYSVLRNISGYKNKRGTENLWECSAMNHIKLYCIYHIIKQKAANGWVIMNLSKNKAFNWQ